MRDLSCYRARYINTHLYIKKTNLACLQEVGVTQIRNKIAIEENVQNQLTPLNNN